jgi:hypothetical protein
MIGLAIVDAASIDQGAIIPDDGVHHAAFSSLG